MSIDQQVKIRRHVVDFPNNNLAKKFAPFAAKILTAQGVAATAPSIDKARAVVGWFAQNAVHPQQYLHPDGTTLNTSVLPSGETWASFNSLFNQSSIITRDQAYWYAIFPDGIGMLQALIGTVATDGTVTDNGLLTEYATGKWRIRSFASFRAPQCTLQCKMAQVVLASLGILSTDISTFGHDPMAFYQNETKEWLYIDPTFGEMQKYNGKYLSPIELLKISLRGEASSITGERLPGAEYLASTYFTSPRTPAGMTFMTIHTASHWAGGLSARNPYAFAGLPSQSTTYDRQGTIEKILPQLGCGIRKSVINGNVVEFSLISNWPNMVKFQRSFDKGVTWSDCLDVDYVNTSQGYVNYRSVDIDGFSGSICGASL